MPTVLWLRRDLRLADHPAMLAAAQEAAQQGDGSGLVPLFVFDPTLWEPAGPPRRAWLLRSLRSLDERLHDAFGGRLVIRHGDPVVAVRALAGEVGATRVHVSADAGVYGRRRDAAVKAALAQDGRELVATGSPYAVGPGTLLGASGGPFKVFSAFQRAWLAHGWAAPAASEDALRKAQPADGVRSEPMPADPDLGDLTLPEPGEPAALERWRAFVEGPLSGYATGRDAPGVQGTSAMSAHLKYGEVHPRTLLADLASHQGEAAERYRSELCWRDFYADVLWHRPESAREPLRADMARLRVDPPGEHFTAWQQGRTGYPVVDAGMRQLLAEGWVHNRARMIVASFLVKDLHVGWQHGARHFMHWLRDGDLASNNHGWQWVAGTGTDPAPFFRVFNPVTQGLKFDPDGDYVRRYVPELRHLPGKAAHEPWKHPHGYDHGYPRQIVDHAAERAEALRRYEEARS
jgi:deoxyribodipyrimidine photo-lyase